jgi:hypothetical protein
MSADGDLIPELREDLDRLNRAADEAVAQNPDDPQAQRLKESIDELTQAIPRMFEAMETRIEEVAVECERNARLEEQFVPQGYVAQFPGSFRVAVETEDAATMKKIKAARKRLVVVHAKNKPPTAPSVWHGIGGAIKRGWFCFEVEDDFSCLRGGPFSAIGDEMRREIHYSPRSNSSWAKKLKELFPHDRTIESNYERNLGEYCYRHAEELGFVFLTRIRPYGTYRLMIDEDLKITDD